MSSHGATGGDASAVDASAADKTVAEEAFYQNAEIFRLQSDPFGQDFERSLTDAPALPVRRKYSRENSASSGTHFVASKKSSYDEMSVNAGKPVFVASNNNESDRLTDVAFDGPLKELEAARQPTPRAQPVPVPAPRLSKLKRDRSEEEQEESAYMNDVIYEELSPRSSPWTEQARCETSLPDVPPRNTSASASSSAAAFSEADQEDATRRDNADDCSNIYTEVDIVHPPLSASKSLLETEDEPSEALSPTLTTQLGGGDGLGEVRAKLATIDIRKDVHRLYHMAVEELHRDQTFVEFLEKRESGDGDASAEEAAPPRDAKKSVNAYDSVAVPNQRFKIVDGVQVPIPVTILKDFDPCFDKPQSRDDECLKSSSSSSSRSSSFDEKLDQAGKVGDSDSLQAPMTHRDSTTSFSSNEIPIPAVPPPPPPTLPSQQAQDEKPQLDHNKRVTYENVWIPPEEDARPVLKENVAQRPEPAKKSPSPIKPKRISKQISSSFGLARSQSLAGVPPPTAEDAKSFDFKQGCDQEDTKSNSSFSKESSASCEVAKESQLSPTVKKRAQKSASSTNLAFLTKRLSFSKFSRKVADQSPSVKPMPSSPALVEEEDDVSLSSSSLNVSVESAKSSRRKSSLLSDIAWPGTTSHSGPLYVNAKGKKAAGALQEKWVVLGSANLSYFNQRDSMAEPKERVLLKDVLSLYKRVDEGTFKSEGESSTYCFDVAFIKPGKGSKLSIRSFGSASESTRDTWVDKIAQSLSTGLANFSMTSSEDCGKLGWVYLKTMFAGEWRRSWIALKGSSFLYQSNSSDDVPLASASVEGPMEQVDLKKTKNVTLVRDVKNLGVIEPALPVLVVDFADRSLYLQSRSEKESLHWKSELERVAFSNRPLLSDQQLTKDGVPVVVEMCVNFVFRHGCMSEGIYRHSGVKTKIDRLLAEFAGNVWSVALTREDFSEHDVAGALKRFMRTLEQPLLTAEMRERWLEAAGASPGSKKVQLYVGLLCRLPEVNRLTLRRLIGHLRAVSNQSERNRMPDFNLAAIWGPTLLTVDTQAVPTDFAQTSAEADVCRDLIEHYRTLFNVTDEEISREEKIMMKTENFNRNPNPIKLSGEVMMFVYFDTKTGGDCVSVAVTPKMTAHELQRRAIKKANYAGSVDGFVLHEVILRGEMERPIHYKELIYDVTLKWWKWPDEDRKDTYLLLKRNAFLDEAYPCAVPPLSVFGEAYFGDNSKSNKAFKKFMFSMNNAKITRSKEGPANSSSGAVSEIECWNIEKIIWYVGCEAKRRPPNNLNVTFIDRDVEGGAVERSRERPFFGRTISFGSRELFVKWIAAMLVAEHGVDILPCDTLLNIDDD